ncbi:MAG: hypothetical protein JO202_07350 [Ktedonobacteraceae bacterium]|nr:hypothetical protein [Ktedonobacteraceae bacterium]
MVSTTTSTQTSLTSEPVPFPFLLQFLEAAHPVASEETVGAPTETETGEDGTKPTEIDSVEDEDVTGTDDDED